MGPRTPLIIVGAGRWGINHISTAHQLGLLCAVVDCDPVALDRSKQTLPDHPPSHFYTTLSTALQAHLRAAVIVATPPITHFAIACEAIASKRHVLVEKPLCDTFAHARELVQMASDARVCLMVDHLLQYSVHHCRLLQLIRSGFVGDVTRVKMTRVNFGTVRTEENVLWSFTPHDVSVLLAICGNEVPNSVACVGQRVVSCGIEDYVDMSLRFESGVQAQIEASWMHPLKERRLVVYGTKGAVILNEAMPDPNAPKLQGFKWSAKRKSDGSAVVIEKQEQDLVTSLREATGDPNGLHSGAEKPPLLAAIEHFLECVESNATPITDGNEGTRVLQVLQAAKESLEKDGVTILLSTGSQCSNVFVHPTAVVDSGAVLGPGSKVWHFSHVMPGAKLGSACNIGQNVYIGGKAVLGRNVKVQNNVSIYDAVNIDDDVFLGPSCVLTNVKTPRSHISRKHAFEPTIINKGVTVGANATVICGVKLGQYCFIGAGAVVTKDIPPHALVYGNPATLHGWVSTTGVKLAQVAEIGDGRKVLQCSESKEVYTLYEKGKGCLSGPRLERTSQDC